MLKTTAKIAIGAVAIAHIGVLGHLVKNTSSVPAVNIPPVNCLLYTSPSPRDRQKSRMPSSA